MSPSSGSRAVGVVLIHCPKDMSQRASNMSPKLSQTRGPVHGPVPVWSGGSLSCSLPGPPLCIRVPRKPQDSIPLRFENLGGVRIAGRGHRPREGKGDTCCINACSSHANTEVVSVGIGVNHQASLPPTGVSYCLAQRETIYVAWTGLSCLVSMSSVRVRSRVLSFGAARGQGRTLGLVLLDTVWSGR
jgi:hypothetical protein